MKSRNQDVENLAAIPFSASGGRPHSSLPYGSVNTLRKSVKNKKKTNHTHPKNPLKKQNRKKQGDKEGMVPQQSVKGTLGFQSGTQKTFNYLMKGTSTNGKDWE